MYLVTSFGFDGWERYAKKHVETFVEFWPDDSHLFVGYHDTVAPGFNHPRVTFFDLHADPLLVEFKQKYGNVNGNTPQGYSYRYDAVKFSNKVFAIAEAATRASAAGGTSITWLDGDTFTTRKVNMAELVPIRSQAFDVGYLGRTVIDYAETSLIVFNFSERTAKFIRDLLSFYTNGTFLHQREFHDGWLFSRLLETSDIQAYNFTPEVPNLDAFSRSPVGSFMTHLKGALKDGAAPALAPGLQPLKVLPRDCMPADYTAEHIKKNTPRFKKMIAQCWPHARKAIIVGAGPSLRENFDAIRKAQSQSNAYVVCVKHSFPILRSAGIVPNACLVLDPRPFDGESTHLKKRSSLLEQADPRTTFYVASMTSHEYIDFLEARKAPIVGWHAMTKALQESGVLKPTDMAIAGGTCSVIRALAVFHAMGFRRFTFYGLDASVAQRPAEEADRKDDSNRPWWLEVSPDPDGARKFWSTGEMVALAQDIEMLAKQMGGLDSDIEVVSSLLAGAVWTKVKPQLPPRTEFKDWLNGN